MLLKPKKEGSKGLLSRLFGGFNTGFDKATAGYVGVAGLLVRRSWITMVIVAGVIVGAALFGSRLPAGFIPDEDQGILGVNVQLPPAASLERTAAVLTEVEKIIGRTEGVESYATIGGYGMVTNTYQPNFGSIFIRLLPWEERQEESVKARGIMTQLAREFAAIPDAIVFPFNIPTISGFGASAGFNFLLQDRSGSLSVPALGAQTETFLAAARQRPELANLFTSFDPGYPQVKVELDREKARTLGVPVDEVFQAMSAVLGGSYVNDFNRFGRLYRVYVQAEAEARREPGDIGKIYVRSRTTGSMVPLSTLVTISSTPGAEVTTRFNLLRSVEISGVPAPGYTSGQALAALEAVFAETMPQEMDFAYSSLSYQEKTAPPAGPTFAMAIIFVFLLLAAMYESWRLPWAVLLGSPMVALGAFFGVWLMGFDNNVYVQIGNIMLIGLAAKNAILIVEFAKAKTAEGKSVKEAAIEAARLRFRPILMTAFAFILGVVPLMLASGAGAGAQNVMGTAVFWGMLVATALGVFLIPGNFAFIEGLGAGRRAGQAAPAPAAAGATASGGAGSGGGSHP
jgi:HAE1 family hydrophobic/amphiphilic exporter-1